MRKSYLYYTVAVFALLAVTIESCKKEDGFNNNTIIETPYGLYFADTSGALFNTNNGDTVKPMVFPPDGYAPRALCVSGLNVLFAKADLQVSTNNGINFNTAYSFLNPGALNQSMILNSDDEGRIYVSSVQGNLGLSYSDSNGSPKTWHPDNYYDSANIHSLPVSITTLTELKNNIIIGYDPALNRVFAKYSKADKWEERTGPAGSSSNLPGNNHFTLGHFNNTIVAIDNYGINGAYYSNDTGKTWTKYTGLPARRLYAVASPFDQVLLVGTDSFGVYRLDNGTFIPSSVGMSSYSVIRGIVGKENIYKNNNTIQQYIYVATNNGLYRSQDMAQSWSLVQKGNFVAAY